MRTRPAEPVLAGARLEGAPVPPELNLHVHRLLETLPAAAYVCDPDGLITYYNAQAVRVWGRKPALKDPVDRFCGSFRLYTPAGEPLAHEDCWMARALRERRAYQGCEISIEQPDGERIPALAYATPTFDAEGRLIGAVNVLVDISERKKLEVALEQADARKDEFLAVLGHELRNPLSPILNAVEFLRGAGPPDPSLIEARDVIERQVAQLKRLIDDLLDVGRITRGRMELRRETLLVSDVVRCAVETARPALDERGHTFEVTVPDEPTHVRGDSVRLSQALQNLLLNAARYTDPGGHVALSVELSPAAPEVPTEVVVAVTDDGAGIPASELGSVFEMFVQLGRESLEPRNGLGVGLTLVRSIVEQHGGTVRAESAGPGAGSRFGLRLPLARSGTLRPVPSSRVPSAHRSRRVLVVDDHEDSCMSLDRLLRVEGHLTATALDAAGALRAGEEFRPEVVLLDIGLPDMDGLEVCRRMRARAWGRDAFLVAITGWGRAKDRRGALEAGFDVHLTKPVDLASLREVLAGGDGDPEPRAGNGLASR